MMFNTTFNNNSATSWRSVLLVEDAGVPEDKLYYMMLYQVHPISVEFSLILLDYHYKCCNQIRNTTIVLQRRKTNFQNH